MRVCNKDSDSISSSAAGNYFMEETTKQRAFFDESELQQKTISARKDLHKLQRQYAAFNVSQISSIRYARRYIHEKYQATQNCAKCVSKKNLT